MNLNQLRSILKVYDCHVGRMERTGVQIFAPNYGTSEIVADWEHKQAPEIKTVAERLSGKKIRELWTGRKGGSGA